LRFVEGRRFTVTKPSYLPTPLVFQYGSNCTAARLNGPKRLNGHAEDRGRAQTVEDFDIAFDVYSQTNSCAASDLVPTPGRKAWGVLFLINDFNTDAVIGRHSTSTPAACRREAIREEAVQCAIGEYGILLVRKATAGTRPGLRSRCSPRSGAVCRPPCCHR
jgi:hypothetical protein